MERAAFTLYLIALVLSPLLFGAVHTYAYTVASLGVLTGSLLIVRKNIGKEIKSGVYQFQFPDTGLNFVFFTLLIFLVFQVIPLPASLLGFLSPEATVVGQKSLPASSALISEGPIENWFSLSPYYYPVRMSIMRWSVYVLFFLGLTQTLNSRKRIELTIFLILITGCFEALYGLAQTYSGSHHIWWFKKIGSYRDVTGTYLNRNHFAGLMEMCLLLAAAYAAALPGMQKRRKIISGHKTNLRVRLSRYVSGEQRFNKRSLMVFSGAVIGIGLVFSASRAGIVSAAAALLCMSLLFIVRRNHRRKGFIVLFLFLITSVYALHIGVEYPVGRFKYLDVSITPRARYAQKTMDLFGDYKVTGVGVGNFQYAYPKYQAAEDKNVFIRHAHNDWAQFLAEAGIIGLCLLVAGMSYYVYRIIRLWRKRTDPFAICLGVAPLGVMTAMAIHPYSDFNQHVMARGIEGREIFKDDKDRKSLLGRLANILDETQTQCYAWALLPNHLHLLLRTGPTPLRKLMRRLMTGYAVTFNKRHTCPLMPEPARHSPEAKPMADGHSDGRRERIGHLFQNRYKSIVCEEDAYLLELIRYIHLNPLRASLVNDLKELDKYLWTGHSTILGKRENPLIPDKRNKHKKGGKPEKILVEKTVEDILLHFGETAKIARRRYRQFVKNGVDQARPPRLRPRDLPASRCEALRAGAGRGKRRKG